MSLALVCTGASAASPKSQTHQLLKRLSTQEPLRNGVWGMLAVTMGGDTLVDFNSHMRMLPASTEKLITTGLALRVLGPDYRFRTRLAYDGVIENGVLHGDLYIVGEGDPTVGADFGCASGINPFVSWRKMVQDAGIEKIDGRLIGDSRFYEGDPLNGSWQIEDLNCGDAVGVEGLNYYRDTLVNHTGAFLCARAFNTFLMGAGLSVPIDRVSDEASSDSLKFIGESFSPRLRQIVRDCNHRSNNFYAEAMLRAIGKKLKADDSYDASVEAMLQVLAGMGLGTKSRAIQISDGSGLSRKNYQTPDFLVSFLTVMAGTRDGETFQGTLPKPGEGSLVSRLHDAPQSVKGRVCMKSGSMNGVRCYSGYILPSDGVKSHTIVFSFMSNNAVVSQKRLSTLTDQIITSLASEN